MVTDTAKDGARRVPFNPPLEAKYMSVDGSLGGKLSRAEHGRKWRLTRARPADTQPVLFDLHINLSGTPGLPTLQGSMGSGFQNGS